MKLLFVCGRNQWRSPTAAQLFARTQHLHTRSAGTAKSARHRVTMADLTWADHVLVMEHKHVAQLRERFGKNIKARVHVLDIPDDYEFMDPALIALLEERVGAILDTLEA